MFENESGVYWAVCESLSYIQGAGYVLDNIQEDSLHGESHPWVKALEDWKTILVEEA